MLYDPGTMIFQFCLVLFLLYMAYLSGAILVLTLIEKWRARRKRIQDAKLFLLAGHRVK